MPLPGEFDIIAHSFAPLAADEPGAFGLENDAALLSVGGGGHVVATADMLVEGVHFREDDPPELIARKLLRVNLSDLAACGAAPLAYILTLALRADLSPEWIGMFSEGLEADQRTFGVHLLGGDTTSTPGPLTLSLTALGTVEGPRCLERGTARPGQLLYVSGALGDAGFGLEVLTGGHDSLDRELRDALVERYRLPQPRIELGRRLLQSGLARAAIDISDGLVADLGHICETSGLGAEIEAERVPLSPAGKAIVAAQPEALERVLGSGDDYELLFAVEAREAEDVEEMRRELGLPITRIGQLTEEPGVRVADANGEWIVVERPGWSHF